MFKKWARALLRKLGGRPQDVTYDTLDIAYIAIGAKKALEENGDEGRDRFEGELSYIQECVYHARLLHKLWLECEESFPGVWCYEMAEPFGEHYGRHILQGGSLSDAERIARELLNDCMSSH